MSSLDTETFAAEQPNQRTVCRAVAEFMPGKGRTIDVQIVPYGVPAEVSDGGPLYREMWMPGAFADQVRAASSGRARQVFVNFEHPKQMRVTDVLGHGLSLREAPDAFYGSFVMHDDAEGDKALQMVKDGLIGGVSLEAYPKKSIRSKDGVVQRVKAHLVNIALCRRPAFETAGILAVREEGLMFDEETMPVELAQDVVDRCRRLGIRLPDRFGDQVARAFVETPWDGSASRWATAEAYCSASAIDLNPSGKTKMKSLCHLPYKEPGSDAVNLNGVRAALARIGQGDPKDATPQQRDEAKTILEKLLHAGTPAQRAMPVEMPSDETGDTEAMAHLDSMIAMAEQFIAAEDDPGDKAAMQRVLSDLRALRGTEGSEAD